MSVSTLFCYVHCAGYEYYMNKQLLCPFYASNNNSKNISLCKKCFVEMKQLFFKKIMIYLDFYLLSLCET